MLEEAQRRRLLLEEENRALRMGVGDEPGLVGQAPAFRRVLELARRVAASDVTVLIRGESGTGKERLARLLHSLSARQKGPFVPLNCAAVPETLLEAELFGIEKGVATGVTARPGKFELANGGTLFLDEIGDLTPVLQAKLLRVVQEREVERIGGRQRVRVDVRLVTATNRNLEEMLAKGEFRQDLYYRLRVVELTMPPLRERYEDIPLLAQHFVRQHGRRMGKETLRLARGALEILLRHDFPGNVRELENLLEAAAALASGDKVEAEDLALALGAGRAPAAGQTGTLEEVIRAHVARTLDRCGGNRGATARALGIDRTTLYRMMMRWNATHDEFRNVPENARSKGVPRGKARS
jgi:two-component system response regulator HydG